MQTDAWGLLLDALDEGFTANRRLAKVRLGRQQMRALFGELRPQRLGYIEVEAADADDLFEAVYSPDRY